MKRESRAPLVLALVLLPVLYVLSIGPAYGFVDGGGEFCVRLFGIVYAPIFWLVENGPTWIGDSLNWYWRLWHTLWP
jgi:nitrate reductase NapE component